MTIRLKKCKVTDETYNIKDQNLLNVSNAHINIQNQSQNNGSTLPNRNVVYKTNNVITSSQHNLNSNTSQNNATLFTKNNKGPFSIWIKKIIIDNQGIIMFIK